MREINEGDLVVCTTLSPNNPEGLKLGMVYKVLGWEHMPPEMFRLFILQEVSIAEKIVYTMGGFEHLSPLEGTLWTVEKVRVDDLVNHPNHYTTGKYEVIDIIEDATRDLSGIVAVCIGNAIKYILRHPYKGRPIEDLKKAVWYLNKAIAVLEARHDDK